MMAVDLVRVSKFLSLVLRHEPQRIGLTLDENGWADVSSLLDCANQHGQCLSREVLETVVANNDKKRFAFNLDGKKIRASQGHSIGVDLALPPQQPPEVLFHGTAIRFLESIRAKGLVPGSRQHVHLSLDEVTATKVGSRHGKPVVLKIRSGEMYRSGQAFYCSENGVWLTDNVPVSFIQFGND